MMMTGSRCDDNESGSSILTENSSLNADDKDNGRINDVGDDDFDDVEKILLRDILKITANRASGDIKDSNNKHHEMNASQIADMLMKIRLDNDENPQDFINSTGEGTASIRTSDDQSTCSTSLQSQVAAAVSVEDGVPSSDPNKVLEIILTQKGYGCSPIAAKDIPDDFFLTMTEENMEAYTNETLTAIRNNDVSALKQMMSEGKNLQCCNKFGESIISLACRHGNSDVVDFLINEAGVKINIQDDFGRTPLHDAFWARSPNFTLVELLLKECSDLLLVEDKRGSAPLGYVKDENQNIPWSNFLWQHRGLVEPESLGKAKGR
jgi:hypothetical protein